MAPPSPWTSESTACVVVDADLEVVAATLPALARLGCPDRNSFATRWSSLREAVATALRDGHPVACPGAPLVLTASELVAGDRGPGRYLVILEDRRQREELDHALFLALRTSNYLDLCRPMAHAIRGPLNAMALNVELLQDLWEDDTAADPSRAQQLAQRAVGVLGRSFRHLSELLELQLRETGRPNRERSTFALLELLDDVFAPVRVQLEDRQIGLELPRENPGLELDGYRDHLRVALGLAVSRILHEARAGDMLRVSLEVADVRRLRFELLLRDAPSDEVETPPSDSKSLFDDVLHRLLAEFSASYEAGRPAGAYVQQIEFQRTEQS